MVFVTVREGEEFYTIDFKNFYPKNAWEQVLRLLVEIHAREEAVRLNKQLGRVR